MTIDHDFVRVFKTETWILYSVAVAVAALRMYARLKRLGPSGLQADDYLTLFAVVCYTVLCVAINEVIGGGGSNLLTEEDIRELTPQSIVDRVRGSKWVFVSEHAMLFTIFSLKACMILIYYRLTDGVAKRRLVNYLAIYVGLGFIGSELALLLICRPIANYWAVPTPYSECSTYRYYEIVQGILAISADVLMLLFAIPLVLQVHVPLRSKLILLFLFGMGIFVIVSAVLTKVYCLVPSLISYVYLNWYFREATVAVLVTCLPLTWPLIRDIFPGIKSFLTSTPSRRATGRQYAGTHPRATQYTEGSVGLHSMDQAKPRRHGSSLRISDKPSNESGLYLDDEEPLRPLHIRRDITITVRADEQNPSNGQPKQSFGAPRLSPV